jgi:hypothetical protein
MIRIVVDVQLGTRELVMGCSSTAKLSSQANGSSATSDYNSDITTDYNSDQTTDHSDDSTMWTRHKTPIYSHKALSKLQLLQILCKPIHDKLVSGDCHNLKHSDDLKCDDLGVFRNNSHTKTHYNNSQTVVKNSKEACFILEVTYFTHKSMPSLTKKIVELTHKNKANRYAARIYTYSRGPHRIIVQPHGNSSTNQAYSQTKPSVINCARKNLKTTDPKYAFDELIEEEGGIMHLNNTTNIPRNVNQLYSIKGAFGYSR